MRAVILVLLIVTAPVPARAEDFCADRPGLATGTCVVPVSRLQIESSLGEWSVERDSGERTATLSLFPTTLRFGVTSGLELQASAEPLVRSGADGAGDWNRGDLGVALKARLTSAASPIQVALYPSLARPAGRRQLEASLLIPVSFNLGPSWGLTLTPQAAALNDEDGHGRHGSAALAASLGRDLGQRWSAALDLLAADDMDPAGSSHSLAAGLSVAWQARPNFQLDVEADKGVAGPGPDLSLAAGFAWRP